MSKYLRPKGTTYNEWWLECPVCNWRGNSREAQIETGLMCPNQGSPAHMHKRKYGQEDLLNIVDRMEYEPAR